MCMEIPLSKNVNYAKMILLNVSAYAKLVKKYHNIFLNKL